MASANSPPSPGACATLSTRDHEADSDDSIPRKKQRLSEEAEDDVVIEANVPEDVGDSASTAITIMDEPDMALYSELFSLNIEMTHSAVEDLELLFARIAKLDYITPEHFFMLADWLVDHVNDTDNDSMWRDRCLRDRTFFERLAQLSVALLETNDLFNPRISVNRQDVLTKTRSFYTSLTLLSARMAVWIPYLFDDEPTRRDSVHISKPGQQQIPFLHWITVLQKTLASSSMLSVWMRETYRCDMNGITIKNLQNLLDTPGLLDSLNKILRILSERPRDFADSWPSIASIIDAVSCIALRVRRGLSYHGHASSLRGIIGILNNFVMPAICRKHPRALPEEFHEHMISRVTLILSSIVLYGDLETASQTFEECVHSPDNYLLCEVDDRATESRLCAISDGDLGVLSQLLCAAWSMHHLSSYIASDIMDIRSIGVMTMSRTLRDYHSKSYESSGLEHPVIQFLARFLRGSEMTKYLFSADSHANLVVHSRDIVAFLAATSMYTDHETDIIWNACTTSVEAEFVKASFEILDYMKKWFTSSQLLHLVSLYVSTPMQNLGRHAAEFLDPLFDALEERSKCYVELSDRLAPALYSLQILKATASHTTTVAEQLRKAASRELFKVANLPFCTADRLRLYKDCVQEISSRSRHATTCLEIMCIFLRTSLPPDEAPLILSMLPAKAVANELSHFVRSSHCKVRSPRVSAEINTRLNTFIRLLHLDETVTDSDTETMLWKCTIGDSAPNNETREAAWANLVLLTRDSFVMGTAAELLSRCLSNYIPDLPTDFATPSLVAQMQSVIASRISTDKLERSYAQLLEIPHWQQLVRIAITAKDADVAGLAIQAVCLLLFEEPRRVAAKTQAVMQCHAAFVRQHIERLQGMYPNITDEETARVFTKAIDLLDVVLQKSRAASEYLALEESGDIILAGPGDEGGTFTFTVQLYEPRSSPALLRVQANKDSRIAELVRSLEENTTVIGHDLILGGKLTKLDSIGDQSLEEVGIHSGGAIIIRPRYSADCDFCRVLTTAGPVEQEILDNYDQLESFLDSPPELTQQVYSLISKLRPTASARLRVNSTAPASTELFPHNNVWKSMYHVDVLNNHLRDCNLVGVADSNFLLRGVSLLAELLLDTARPFQPPLLALALDALVSFLQETPLRAPPPPYIDSPESLAIRLMALQMTIMEMPILLATQQISYRTYLAKRAYAAMLQITRVHPPVWDILTAEEQFAEVHGRLILDADPALTTELVSLVNNFSRESSSASDFYLRLVLKVLPYALGKGATAAPFFRFAVEVLSGNVALVADEERVRTIIAVLVSSLEEYQHSETPDLPLEDSSLTGLLKLLSCVIHIAKGFKKPLQLGTLASDIFARLLFPSWDCCERCSGRAYLGPSEDSGSESEPTSRATTSNERSNVQEAGHNTVSTRSQYHPLLTTESRSAALDLVYNTCDNRGDCVCIVLNINHALQLAPRECRRFSALDSIRLQAAPAGLTNLGMTCYMNSLLQQVYANLHFRKFIFDAPITDPQTQGLLICVQTLFAYMQNGAAPYMQTHALATYLGTQVDAQEDVHGFYHQLIGGLEESMPDEDTKACFTKLYTGKLLSQIRGDCGHIMSLEEPFTELSVVVQNKGSLHDSLDEFVQGEPMKGSNKYRCQTCDPQDGGRLVDAMKRTCLDAVPDHLTLCLKRFNYDMSNLEEKVNDRFEFPSEIDMAAYGRKHLEDPNVRLDPDIFELVGVIIHSGTLAFGHYWSYSRVRGLANRAECWTRLEDAQGRYSSLEEMQNDSFGDGRQLRNAYVLFYQRQTSIQEAYSLGIHGPGNPDVALTPKVAVPAYLDPQIYKDCQSQYRIVHLFNDRFDQFTRWLIQQSSLYIAAEPATVAEPESERQPADEVREAAEDSEESASSMPAYDLLQDDMSTLLVDYLLRIMLPSSNTERMVPMLAVFDRFVSASPRIAQQILTLLTPNQAAFDEILRHISPNVRTQVFGFVLKCISLVRDHFPEDYPSCIRAVIDAHCALLTGLDTRTIRWREYFDFAGVLAQFGPEENQLVLEAGYLAWAVEVICMKWEESFQLKHLALCQTAKDRRPAYEPLFDFIHSVVGEYVDFSDLAKLQGHEETYGVSTLVSPARVNGRMLIIWVYAAPVLLQYSGQWEDFSPGKLVGLLASSDKAHPDLTWLIRQSLSASFSLTEVYLTPLLYMTLHYCSKVEDNDDLATVLQELGKNLNEWPEPEKDSLIFMVGAMDFAPCGVTLSVPHWVPIFLMPKRKSKQSTETFLKMHVFDPSPLTMSSMPEIGERRDVCRIRAVRALCDSCLPKLRYHFDRGYARAGFQSMLDVMQEAKLYFDRLSKQVRKVNEDGGGRQLSQALMAESGEARRTLSNLNQHLLDMRGWDTDASVDEDESSAHSSDEEPEDDLEDWSLRA